MTDKDEKIEKARKALGLPCTCLEYSETLMPNVWHVCVGCKAAATITSLREELDRARKALEPFGEWGEVFLPDTPGGKWTLESPFVTAKDDVKIQLGATPNHGWYITIGQFRSAAYAIRAAATAMGGENG